MTSSTRERVISATVVFGLAAVLVLLAVLQYRWSGQVSEAEGARMKARLQSSVIGFRQDLHRELSAVCLPFQSVSEPGMEPSLVKYAQAYQAWKQSTVHAGLVRDVYVLNTPGAGRTQLLRLNTATGDFEPDNETKILGELIARLTALPEAHPPEDFEHASSPHKAHDEGQRREHPTEEIREPGRGPGRGFFRRGLFGGFWAFDQNVPALVHAIPAERPPAGHDERPPQAFGSWLVIQLDSDVLKGHILPELAERYFSGPEGMEYEVAVTGDGPEPVYRSDASFGKSGAVAPDATMNLFGFPGGPPPQPGQMLAMGSNASVRPSGRLDIRERHAGGFGLLWIDRLRYSADEKDWQLVVRHRKGSLDTVVAAARRRNLAVSFGVLLVLAATMGIIIAATRRAQRLANLQMEFVTGVSHELRTPLSVIASAADNIADGVVANKQQLARYGTVIKKQAMQLNHLIEQVLLFAATRQDRLRYNLAPLEVNDLIHHALSSTEDLVHSAGVTVEQAIEPNLPPVMGDLPAISHCLQNLITNAVKYGGQDRWMAVRAFSQDENGSGKFVQISVEDHGAGIARAEQEEIFQPFYRSAAATAAQIHGTGLGLPLAKSIAEAMGGELFVVSELGKGSTFILRLRVAQQATMVREGEGEAITNTSSQTD